MADCRWRWRYAAAWCRAASRRTMCWKPCASTIWSFYRATIQQRNSIGTRGRRWMSACAFCRPSSRTALPNWRCSRWTAARPRLAVVTLWEHTGGLSPRHARKLLADFAARSLVQLSPAADGDKQASARMTLHDLLHNFAMGMAEKRFGSLAALHQTSARRLQKDMSRGLALRTERRLFPSEPLRASTRCWDVGRSRRVADGSSVDRSQVQGELDLLAPGGLPQHHRRDARGAGGTTRTESAGSASSLGGGDYCLLATMERSA